MLQQNSIFHQFPSLFQKLIQINQWNFRQPFAVFRETAHFLHQKKNIFTFNYISESIFYFFASPNQKKKKNDRKNNSLK